MKKFISILIFIFSLLTIIGCSGSPEIINKNTEIEIKKNLGELVIYSGRKESLVGPIIKLFSDSTGTEVKVKYGASAALAALLMEEGDKSPADIFYAQDPGAIGSVEKMLQPINKSIFTKTSITVNGKTETSALVPDWAKSRSNLWIGITGRARVVVYNTIKLTESDLPDTIMGFCDPKWKGQIGWAPSNSSFQTMITAMRLALGEEETKQWIECIRDNKAIIYPGNAPQVQAVAKGEIDIGFVNHYYLYKFKLDKNEGEQFNVSNYHPRGAGPGSLMMVSAAGILKTSKNEKNAEKFIDFLLSELTQEYFSNVTREYPLVEGIKIHPLLTSLEKIGNSGIILSELQDIVGSTKLLTDAGVLD